MNLGEMRMGFKNPQKAKEYRKRNAEKIREQKRRYNREHKQQATTQVRSWRAELRTRVLEYLGGKCVRCGFDDPRTLQIDHINGGGHKDYRQHPSQYAFYKGIIERKRTDVQILCANCNWIKRSENKEHG